MPRHELSYDRASPLIKVLKTLEECGASIYHVNKDRGLIGIDIPEDKLEGILNLAGFTLAPDSVRIL